MTEMPAAQTRQGGCLLGAPTCMVRELVVAAPHSPHALQDVPAALAERAHRRGAVSAAAGRLTWVCDSDIEQLRIEIDATGPDVRVRLQARWAGLAALVYVTILFAVLFLTAAVCGFAVGVRSVAGMSAGALMGLGLGTATARFVWQRVAAARGRELAGLAGLVCGVLGGERLDQES